MDVTTIQGTGLAECLEKLLRLALASIKASQGALLLKTNEKTLRFLFVASRSGLERHARLFDRLVGQDVPIGKGVTGLAALERKPHCAFGGNAKAGFFRVAGDGAPSAVMAVPMMCQDTLFGVMTAISFDTDRMFSQDDMDTYCKYADVSACIIKYIEREGSHGHS